MEKENNIFDHLKPRRIEVPDPSYFDQLSKKVVMEHQIMVIPFYRKPITWIGAAAATIAVILLTNLYASNASEEQYPLLALNTFSKDEIAAYIKANIHNFETELIEEYIPEDSLNILIIMLDESISNKERNDISVSLDEINKDDILDYFDEYEVDPYELDEDDIFI